MFGDVVLGWRDMRASLFFEARGVGDPRIFGTGLGGKARGSTDDGGDADMSFWQAQRSKEVRSNSNPIPYTGQHSAANSG